MSAEDDHAAVAAKEDADFASGFPEKPPATPPSADKPADTPAKPEPKAAPVRATEPATEKPEYVQISAKDWADVRAAAAKTASYDAQLSKAFGTIGNLQRLVSGLQAQTPAGRKIEVPKDAFLEMSRDFPELAEHTRNALERALAGVTGTGANDADASGKFQDMLASYTAKREIEALEDSYPDWRKIVGAVDITKEQPDPNNAFRKWLATKDVAYQNRLNSSESAAVIGRAIRTFQNETKAVAKPGATTTRPRDDARAERIRGAVQPRGDNAGAAAGKSDDEMFEEGFRSR
jgi:hypothetical protein